MKYFKKISKLTVMMLSVIILSTLGIDAFDNRSDLSGSLLGSVIGVGSKERSLCPEGMSYISSAEGSFCIDAYTVSAGKDCPYLKPSSQSETRVNLNDQNCKAVSVAGADPWRWISQTQAQTACSLAGKRLASGKEWYEAAQGTPSDNRGLEGCNLFNNWFEQPGPTGTGERCVSGRGTYDQVGNVWEWVSDTVRRGVINGEKLPEAGYITSVDATGLVLDTDPDHPDPNYTKDRFWINSEGTRGVMRGGFHGSGTDGGVYSTHAEMTPDFAGRAVGFRCASDVLR